MAIRLLTGITSAAVLAGSMALQAPVVAQEEQRLEEITVVAPRTSREVQDRVSPPYGKVLIEEGSAVVNVADLDLTTEAGMTELENRVRTAADRICNELEEKLPFGQPSTPVCIQRAVDDTVAEVREIMQ